MSGDREHGLTRRVAMDQIGRLRGEVDSSVQFDEFAAGILHRCCWAQQHNDGHPSPAWSTGEQLTAALVLRDRTHLAEMGYTVQQAAQRVHDGMAAPSTDLGAWIHGIRAALPACNEDPAADLIGAENE